MDLVNKTRYDSLHDKFKKMTKQELQKRERQIYESHLSFISSDRSLIYMELGIITQLLYKFQKNWILYNPCYIYHTFTIWEIVASIAILTPASSIPGAGKHKNKEKSKEKRTKTTKNSWLPFDELIFAAFVVSIRETTTGLLAPGKKAPTNASTATNFTKN